MCACREDDPRKSTYLPSALRTGCAEDRTLPRSAPAQRSQMAWVLMHILDNWPPRSITAWPAHTPRPEPGGTRGDRTRGCARMALASGREYDRSVGQRVRPRVTELRVPVAAARRSEVHE